MCSQSSFKDHILNHFTQTWHEQQVAECPRHRHLEKHPQHLQVKQTHFTGPFAIFSFLFLIFLVHLHILNREHHLSLNLLYEVY